MTPCGAEEELGGPVEPRIVPAAQFEGVEGDFAAQGGPLCFRELLKGFCHRLVSLVKGVPQLAQTVRLDPPAAAEHFQGHGVVDAVHALLPALRLFVGQFTRWACGWLETLVAHA